MSFDPEFFLAKGFVQFDGCLVGCFLWKKRCYSVVISRDGLQHTVRRTECWIKYGAEQRSLEKEIHWSQWKLRQVVSDLRDTKATRMLSDSFLQDLLSTFQREDAEAAAVNGVVSGRKN